MHNLQFKLKRIKDFILDLIFPKECLGCKKENTYLCFACREKIELNKKFKCALCHHQTSKGRICPACCTESSLLALWLAADYNNELLQNLIHNLKYSYVEELSEVLADLMIKYLEQHNILIDFGLNKDNTVIVPVPLHRKRYLSRGFNQSDLLAQKIANYYKLSKFDLLLRKRNTLSQINLNRNARQANVKDAFILNNYRNLDNTKKIILIDDVVTTGSTLNECAKVLSQNGFKEIYALVIAQKED
jgi:ComF family protein